jgi:hypothetical protein
MLIIAAIFIYRQDFLVFKSFLCLFEQGFHIQFENDSLFVKQGFPIQAYVSEKYCVNNASLFTFRILLNRASLFNYSSFRIDSLFEQGFPIQYWNRYC